MRVAMLQVASPDDEPLVDRLHRVAITVRREKALHSADLLVLPELWNAGYFAFDDYRERAESLTGRTIQAAGEWAVELGLWIHVGSIVEIDERGRLFNTSVVLGPDGRIANTYRKVHLFGYGSREQQLLTPGSGIAVRPLADLPTGITTCYDLRFPELFRSLVDDGAQQVVICAAWPASRLAHWRLFTSVRAVEQQVWLIACNAVGEQQGVRLGGHSRIVDPRGELLIEAGDDEGFTYADLDPDLPRRVRAEFPALADRRWASGHPLTTSTHIEESA